MYFYTIFFAEITCAGEVDDDLEDLMLKNEENEPIDPIFDDNFDFNDYSNDDIFEPDESAAESADVKAEPVEIESNLEELQLKSKSSVKLHKLDSFLLEKLVTADKGFLKTRFLTSIITKQDQAEKYLGISQPVALNNGSFICHLCLKVSCIKCFDIYRRVQNFTHSISKALQ